MSEVLCERNIPPVEWKYSTADSLQSVLFVSRFVQQMNPRIPIIAVIVLGFMLMKFSWKTVLGVGAAVVAAGVALLYRHQDKLLYFPQVPTREYMLVPRKMAINHSEEFDIVHEDVNFVASDGVKLHGWFFRHPDRPSTAPTVIYFHGNAGSKSLTCFLAHWADICLQTLAIASPMPCSSCITHDAMYSWLNTAGMFIFYVIYCVLLLAVVFIIHSVGKFLVSYLRFLSVCLISLCVSVCLCVGMVPVRVPPPCEGCS